MPSPAQIAQMQVRRFVMIPACSGLEHKSLASNARRHERPHGGYDEGNDGWARHARYGRNAEYAKFGFGWTYIDRFQK